MANFFTEGITITHSDLSRIDLGRLSGMFSISWSTSPACFRRSASCPWAGAGMVAPSKETASRMDIFFMFSLAPIFISPEHPSSERTSGLNHSFVLQIKEYWFATMYQSLPAVFVERVSSVVHWTFIRTRPEIHAVDPGKHF